MADDDGVKQWFLNGKRHRTDGPAIEWKCGSKTWYLNGKCHRTDGPAVEWSSGSKEWWLNDKRHRIDGPAAEWVDGNKEWFLNGKKLGDNNDGFHVLWAKLKTDEQRAQLLLNCGGIPR